MSRAIILAAGRGSRMGEATANQPKCLTKLLQKPLLEWQLKSLQNAGLHELYVARGYKSAMLEGNFKTIENTRWNETNMVTTLFCAPLSDKDTIVSYSDIVYHKDHVTMLMEAKGDIVITADKKWKSLWELRFENPLEDAETFKSTNGFLDEIGNKTTDYKDIEAQYMGLLKLTSKGWLIMKNYFERLSKDEKDAMDMTSMLRLLLNESIAITVVFVEGKWCEADHYSDIVIYEDAIKNIKNWSHDWR